MDPSLVWLAICLCKFFAFDFWTFDIPVRVATTITLGGVMIAVSFAYARFRARIADFLTGE